MKIYDFSYTNETLQLSVAVIEWIDEKTRNAISESRQFDNMLLG